MKKAIAIAAAIIVVVCIGLAGLLWFQGSEFDRITGTKQLVINGKSYPIRVQVKERYVSGRSVVVSSTDPSAAVLLSGEIHFGLQPRFALQWITDDSRPQLMAFIKAFHPRLQGDLTIELQPHTVELSVDAGSLSDQSAKLSFSGLQGTIEFFDSAANWHVSMGELRLEEGNASVSVGTSDMLGRYRWGQPPQLQVSVTTNGAQISQVGQIGKQTNRFQVERTQNQWQQKMQFEGEQLDLPGYGITQANLAYEAVITWPEIFNPFAFLPALVWQDAICPWSEYCLGQTLDRTRLQQDTEGLLQAAREGKATAQIANLRFSSPVMELTTQAQAQIKPRKDGSTQIGEGTVVVKKAPMVWTEQYLESCVAEGTCRKTDEGDYESHFVLFLSNDHYVLTANGKPVFSW